MGSVSCGLAYALPTHATRILAMLESAGFEAWVVGGWVRDSLRGAPSHDVDIATSARWQQSEATLRAQGVEVHRTGVRHGTVTAVVCGRPVEVTTYRTEGTYSDHRHPDEVSFVDDVRQDLARRDFTINAMAYHPRRGLLDPFGGVSDLGSGVIRAVGDPDRRLEEDALRVLRAVRFAARLGFAVEPKTQGALLCHASDLAGIAQERVGQELEGIVRTGRLSWALMHETEVMCHAVPELGACVGFGQHSPFHAYDVFEHTVRVCRAVEEFTGGLAPSELRWAAMLHDIAKPVTLTIDEDSRGHFFGHPKRGARMAEDMMRRYALSGGLVSAVRALVRLHDHAVVPSTRSIRHLLRRLDEACPGRARELAFLLIDLKRADAVSKVPEAAPYAMELDQVSAALRREIAAGPCYRIGDLAVSGSDVISALGVSPGPEVGAALDRMLKAVVDNRVANDRDALISLVRDGR